MWIRHTDIIYCMYYRVQKRRPCHERWPLSLSQEAKPPFVFVSFVWTGATVQPWGATLMSFLLACSQHCCCLRSAPASNGCKYCQEAAISFSVGAIWRHLYIQTMSQQMLSLRCMILCGSLLLHVSGVFLALRANGSLEMGPNIPQVVPDQGEDCVLCTCVSDEGDGRLDGSSSDYGRKPLCFINFNAASVKGDGTLQVLDLRLNLPLAA